MSTIIHLQHYGKVAFCGKQAPPWQMATKEHIHNVTCYACLRSKIERLEEEIEEIWMQAAGASR